MVGGGHTINFNRRECSRRRRVRVTVRVRVRVRARIGLFEVLFFLRRLRSSGSSVDLAMPGTMSQALRVVHLYRAVIRDLQPYTTNRWMWFAEVSTHVCVLRTVFVSRRTSIWLSLAFLGFVFSFCLSWVLLLVVAPCCCACLSLSCAPCAHLLPFDSRLSSCPCSAHRRRKFARVSRRIAT